MLCSKNYHFLFMENNFKRSFTLLWYMVCCGIMVNINAYVFIHAVVK